MTNVFRNKMLSILNMKRRITTECRLTRIIVIIIPSAVQKVFRKKTVVVRFVTFPRVPYSSFAVAPRRTPDDTILYYILFVRSFIFISPITARRRLIRFASHVQSVPRRCDNRNNSCSAIVCHVSAGHPVYV